MQCPHPSLWNSQSFLLSKINYLQTIWLVQKDEIGFQDLQWFNRFCSSSKAQKGVVVLWDRARFRPVKQRNKMSCLCEWHIYSKLQIRSNNKMFGCIWKGWISDTLFHYFFFNVCNVMMDMKPYDKHGSSKQFKKLLEEYERNTAFSK